MATLTPMTVVMVGLLSALLTVALMGVAGYWLYRARILPEKKRLEERLDRLGRELEVSIEQGIRRGVKKALAELPQTAARHTTQSVTRVGADLLEYGLSSLIDRPDKRGPKQE